METKKRHIYINLLVIIVLFIVIGIPSTFAQEDPIKVAITPFTINAAEDMQYLQSGIQDMLETRISKENEVVVIGGEETARALKGVQEPVDENEAREIGGKLNARYVLIGSLTVFGSSVSLDAKLVDVIGEQATLAFFDQSQSIDDLVPKINQFSMDVNDKISGAATGAAVAGAVASEPERGDDTREHPEKIAEEEPTPENAETAAVATPKEEGTSATSAGPSESFWKSRRFNIMINGLALGDVDGDGKIETVIITPGSIIVYKNENNRMFKTAEFKGGRFRILIGVDVADINGNGYAEIFVTAQNTQKNRVYSTVFEYDGETFSTTVEDSPWKYRVVEPTPGKPMLLGQKHVPQKPFSGVVFAMRWETSEYRPGEQIVPSGTYNLMGFAYGDVTNSGENSVVAYSDWDKINMYSSTGENIWNGSVRHGGNTLSFSLGKTGKGDEEIQYLPMRLLVKDTNGDGQYEVIVVKNHEIVNNVLTNFRKYSDAEIESKIWNGLGLVPNWKTAKISGYMRDFAIGDMDNDGRDELVGAIIQKEARIIGQVPRSVIIAYQF